jgi:D-alanyl-D-alanine carboxypeptidase (penicillin-binding protein 5/6)
MIPRGTNERILARIVYSGPVRAPVQEGQVIGLLKVWRGDNVVLEVPLHAAETVARGSMTRRAFDAATEFVIGLFLSRSKRI